MRAIIFGIVTVLGLSFGGGNTALTTTQFSLVSTAEAGGKQCRDGTVVRLFTKCPINPAPGVHYKGNAHPENKIMVTICHDRWDELRGGTGQRWWGLTYRNQSGTWQKDIEVIYQKCTTREVVPGTLVGNKHDCDDPRGRWYWTGPVRVPHKTYWVG